MSTANNTNEHGGTNMTDTTTNTTALTNPDGRCTIPNGTIVYDNSKTLGIITGSGFVFGNDVAALYTIRFNDGTITTLSQRDFTVTTARWNVRISHDDGSVSITTHFQKMEAERYAKITKLTHRSPLTATIVEVPSL